MNQINKLLMFIFLVIIGSGCSNDFDIIEGEVQIPIIYALIDVQDTAHYVRVEKAFADPKISATTLALDPNQLYYENITVKLVKVETGESFTLEKVDGNLEGYPREEGAFAQAPNTLYKIKGDVIKLEEEKELRLEVEIPGEETVTSTINLIEKPIPIKPNLNGTIDFPEDKKTSFNWRTGNFAAITSGTLVFRYQEELNGDGNFVDKAITWEPFKNEEKERFEFQGLEFYNFLASNIPNNPSAKRFVLGIDFTFASAGQELEDYLKVSQANLGITSSGEIPNYTNLSRGRGLFTSRANLFIEDMQLSTGSSGSLLTNILTAPLNFQ